MNVEEIRKSIDDLQQRHKKAISGDGANVQAAVLAAPIIQAFGIWEIALQLAELNHNLREGNYSLEVFGALGEP
jgi:hypothetical protein